MKIKKKRSQYNILSNITVRFNIFFKCRSLQLLLCKLFFFMFPSVSQIIVSTWNLFCFLVFFFPNYENEHGFYPFCLVFFIGGDPKSVE